jgi:hypothetical protein
MSPDSDNKTFVMQCFKELRTKRNGETLKWQPYLQQKKQERLSAINQARVDEKYKSTTERCAAVACNEAKKLIK